MATLSTSTETVARPEPFRISATDAELEDLRRRLRATRWPDSETTTDWSQGVPLAYLRDVVSYWAERYDWRAREARINEFPQFRMRVGGLGIHFIHLRSSCPEAAPLLITHGWPGSVVEFLKVLRPLAEPQEYGGEARDAFHVVCPSLPGYGFSDKPVTAGCSVEKIAAIWDELMCALGYSQYWAQGGDWGAAVTTQIAVENRGHCRGIHLNLPLAPPPPQALTHPEPADHAALAAAKRYGDFESGYAILQATRPQTVGYALADSPAGQAAWILEKFWAWTDCDGHPEHVLTRPELLDNVMLYWLTNSAASSARLYWESFRKSFSREGAAITVPTGCSIYPRELSKPPRSWVERRYSKLLYWNELDKGGHFAAFEQPELFVRELRSCFARLRPAGAK
jgi:pimeloyl-ACP methyl ester carboxylesterase